MAKAETVSAPLITEEMLNAAMHAYVTSTPGSSAREIIHNVLTAALTYKSGHDLKINENTQSELSLHQ